MESSQDTSLRSRREAVVREHMESENHHDFDTTIGDLRAPALRGIGPASRSRKQSSEERLDPTREGVPQPHRAPHRDPWR